MSNAPRTPAALSPARMPGCVGCKDWYNLDSVIEELLAKAGDEARFWRNPDGRIGGVEIMPCMRADGEVLVEPSSQHALVLAYREGLTRSAELAEKLSRARSGHAITHLNAHLTWVKRRNDWILSVLLDSLGGLQTRRVNDLAKARPDLRVDDEFHSETQAICLQIIREFDPSLGSTLATHFSAMLTRRLVDLADARHPSTSSGAWVTMSRLAHALSSDYHTQHGRNPSPQQLKDLVRARMYAKAREDNPDLSDSQVQAKLVKQGMAAALDNLTVIMARMRGPVELDRPIDEEGTTRGALIVGAPGADHELLAQEHRTEIAHVLQVAFGGFDDLEKDLVMSRLGETTGSEWTFSQIADTYGVAMNEARGLVANATSRLSAPHAQYAYWAPVHTQISYLTATPTSNADRVGARARTKASQLVN